MSSASTPAAFGRPARHIVWQRWEEPGIEHLYLREENDQVIADGMIVGVIDDQLMRLRYEVQCDLAYQFQTVHVQMLQPFQRTLMLTRSHEGIWRDGEQKILPDLAGAFEIDLTVSPFTNTLPIRRLHPAIDQPVEIVVAYIDLPAFTIRPERQLYTLIRTSSTDNTYRFEQSSIEYTQDIRVDSQGYVIDYPGLFQRVHTQ